LARYIGSVCRLCRREGMKLFLKGDRCLTEKCAIEKRNYAPGQHGKGGKGGRVKAKLQGYGLQLREKQKTKRLYGMLEGQFALTFDRASQEKGVVGETLLTKLERRLDNVVYRLGLAPSRKTARQLITHGHFMVNNKPVDIPSYLLKPGDTIQVREKSKKLEILHSSMKRMKDTGMLPWLSLDKAAMVGTFLDVPARADIPLNADEQLVVELYSK
jgi:small subunit ribosomal protein S4